MVGDDSHHGVDSEAVKSWDTLGIVMSKWCSLGSCAGFIPPNFTGMAAEVHTRESQHPAGSSFCYL
jgi:hypothetical protein